MNGLRRKVINRTCQIEWTEKDHYQRILGRVLVDGLDVNAALVREGWAWHYKRYSDDQVLAQAEDEARAARRGLWAEDNRIAPWDWRNGVREATKEPGNAPSIRTTDTIVYITKAGEKYYTADCRHVRKSKIPIPISRARSAYEPCLACNPGK